MDTTKMNECIENNMRKIENMCEENVSTYELKTMRRTTPSVVEVEKQLCKPDKRGPCCIHGTLMKTQKYIQ